MSETGGRLKTTGFFDLYRCGEASADELDDYVGRWHHGTGQTPGDVPLHSYLGLTREEYEVLLYDPDALPQILAARESRRPLAEVMADRLTALKAAQVPEDGTTIALLGRWLDRESGGAKASSG